MLGFTNDDDFEFVELKNIGTNAVPLGGARFSAGIDFTFQPGFLAPGQFALLVKNHAAFEARYGTGLPVAGTFDGSLDNGGETLRFRDVANEVVFDFAYDDAWQPATDGGGHSLVPVNPVGPVADLGLPASWRASTLPGGSPGADDAAGFTAWQVAHFTDVERSDPLISGPDADPDGDGWSNFGEYAFSTDPRAADTASPIRARIQSSHLMLVFRRLKNPPDVAYRVECAPAVQGPWADAGEEVTLAVVASDETTETVEAAFSTPLSAYSQRFVRVAASAVP